MSKIICDVCGTSFPDSSTHCPICGCASSADNVVISAPRDREDGTHGSYTYIKGGRFSKSNVKKRNSGKHVSLSAKDDGQKAKKEHKSKNSNRGLLITCIALLLAIVAVVIYIAFRFFIPVDTDTKKDTTPDKDPVVEPVVDEPVDEDISCTELTLSAITVKLTEVGQTAKLDVTTTPSDTTDELSFVSEDETVATVDRDGVITAVAAGETVVKVVCGDITAVCEVSCAFEISATTEDEDTDSDNTEKMEDPVKTDDSSVTGEGSKNLLEDGTYRLNTYGGLADFTLNHPETFELQLLDQEGNPVEISITSRGTHVCRVEGNKVISVGAGYCTLVVRFGEGENDFIICEARVH